MENKKYDIVVKQYKTMFVFVLRYFFLFLGIILCIFFFNKIFLTSLATGDQNDPFSLQRTKLVATFEKFLKQTIQDNDINIFILQGPLLTQNNFVISQDNLITYKGFIVPKNLAISTTLPIKKLSYFQDANYDTGEMTNFVNNFILVTQNNSSLLTRNTQIPLNGSLVKTFNLNCLLQTTIYSKACDYYVQNFLDAFFVYQIGSDYPGLQSIYHALEKNDTYRNTFCANIKKYLLYTNDTHETLNTIFMSCGDEYLSFFETMEGFIAIQKQLNNKVINADVAKNRSLNIYKLLSYQQLLYQDFQDLKVRGNQYTLYLDYVQELLKRNGLPQFYIDEVYWYNNEYLKPTLLTARYDSRFVGLKESDITQTIKTIDMINIGTQVAAMTGLVQLVANTGLINTTSNPTPSIASLQDTIAKRIGSISYLSIAQSMINQDRASLKGYFLIGEEKLPILLDLLYQGDSFLVQDVSLPNYASFTSSLQGLIRNRPTLLGELYASIVKDIPLYQNTGSTNDLKSMCKQVRSLESGLHMNVATCTNDALVLTKTQDTQTITYTFFLQNFLPTSIVISDDTIQNAVDNLKGLSSTSLTSIITTVLSTTSSVSMDTTHQGGANTLTALESIQKFLRITPNDVAEKDGKVLVDITLQGVNFIAFYVPQTQTLGPRYFKDILINNTPLPIQKLSLVLVRTGQDTINTFLKNPLSIIKKLDLTAWKNYSEKK